MLFTALVSSRLRRLLPLRTTCALSICTALVSVYNDGDGSNHGHVGIYTWGASSWVQAGAGIDGEGAGDYAGGQEGRLSLSADGKTVAIGGSLNDDAGSNAGHVRVYSLE